MDSWADLFVLADLFSVGADEEGRVVEFAVGEDAVIAGENVGLMPGGPGAETLQHAIDSDGKNFRDELFVSGEPGTEAESIFGQGDGACFLSGGLLDEIFQFGERGVNAGEDLSDVGEAPIDQAGFGLKGGDADEVGGNGRGKISRAKRDGNEGEENPGLAGMGVHKRRFCARWRSNARLEKRPNQRETGAPKMARM